MAGQDPSPGGAAAEDDAIHFNDYDLEAVSKATTWMRTVSSLIYFFGALLAILLGVGMFFGGLLRTAGTPIGAVFLSISVLTIVVLFLGAMFLRKACIAFYDGIAESTETPLAVGFRRLRVFWILFGVYGLVGLAGALLSAGLIAF